MPDMTLIREKLEQIEESLHRIERRFSSIRSPKDFTANEVNLDKLDAIAMMLIAVGESFKKIDIETDGQWLEKYPEIDWRGVIGLRNVLAHDYFDIDPEEIYKICQRDVPQLLNTVQRMLREI
ncbi:MAG TPA: DUF86 domain-containing protein [Sedimentisphaerales bacterium]|nr:DUF86 domain-containing protein [Sedimentisphaerales bacterium]